MFKNAEVVIVGSGVAGASMATVLARRGISVLLLEKSVVHVDHIRGEAIPAWGAAEAREIGILDVLVAAGGQFVSRFVLYGEGVPPEVARARTLSLSGLVPGIAGNLNIGHPQMCQALTEAALAAGARLLRGVGDVTVTPGRPPIVRFVHEGERREMTPRLIVGADGRGSAVARQIGAEVQRDPEHHLMAGLLIDGVTEWPADTMSIGTEGDRTFYIFPLSGGRVRLYLCYGTDQRRLFAGPDRTENFLGAFRLESVPEGEALAAAHAAGPCQGYPNADTWVDRPMAPGVVLVGDAAGHNDPTVGQGVAIAFRDVRLVCDALSTPDPWIEEIFIPYAEERRARMRRLRLYAQHFSKFRCEYTDEARARRRTAFGRIAADPSMALPFLVPLKGPNALPDHAYEAVAWSRMYE